MCPSDNKLSFVGWLFWGKSEKDKFNVYDVTFYLYTRYILINYD